MNEKLNYVTNPAAPHLGGNVVGGDPLTFCPSLWNYFIENYKVRTVADIGCGTGEALRYFQSLGCQTFGVEGLNENSILCPPPVATIDICFNDFLSLKPVDLVWSCELVEHVAAKYLPKLIELLTAGKILAMTHAVPGQPGHNHINCQSESYWIKHLSYAGMSFDPDETARARKLCPPENYFNQSGLIFRR